MGKLCRNQFSTQTYEQRENNRSLKYMYYQNLYNIHRYVWFIRTFRQTEWPDIILHN